MVARGAGMESKTKRFFSRGRIVALFVSLGFTASVSHAEVNARDASYSVSWVDARSSGFLEVKRIYRCRSLANGIFGFGWCSPWEASLRRAPQGATIIRDCEASAEIRFPRAPASAPLARSLSHPGDLLRTERGGGYTRFAPDGSVQRFDSGGRLMSRKDPRGVEVSFVYDDEGRLREAKTRAGHALRFEYKGPSRRLEKITGPGGIKILYSFDDDNLVGVTDQRGTQLTYRYDDLHNMTEAKRSDGWSEKIAYDSGKDWVLKREGADGCIESFSYSSSSSDIRGPASGEDHATTSVTRTCGKAVSRSRYDFWYRTAAEPGRDSLVRAKVSRDGTTFDFVFNPITGVPTHVSKTNPKRGKE